ncbi:MAG: type II toxin-antitoxin system RelE/ParE family toxin [Parachlamydiaceae bacterium]|nr:type II toxin-antitoxin system RelE/ParE family toxin [Parachlamydiaceae bacterium]
MEDKIHIEYYETDNGKCPYLDWEADLPRELRAQIRKRLNRIRLGNFGDFDHIEGSLYELRKRNHSGAGSPIYYGKKRNKILILLCTGDKRSQKRDIERAKKYWLELGG